jgi:Sec-independent protein translocase protein TatA
MLLLALVALLLYGGDLPEVARSWGKMFTEFRRNLTGIQNEINSAIYAEPEPVRKLQYYPEFRHDDPYDAAAASATVVDAATSDAAGAVATGADVPNGEVPSADAPNADVPSGGDSVAVFSSPDGVPGVAETGYSAAAGSSAVGPEHESVSDEQDSARVG